MGASAAGKTTLLDVLSGRKTGGYIERDIMVEGYPKVQQTYAMVSGFCEQTDVHSLLLTLWESLIVLHSGELGQCSSKLIEYFEEKQRTRQGAESSKAGFKGTMFYYTLSTKWMGAIQNMPLETTLSYWRNLAYNLGHMVFSIISSLFYGMLLWNKGQKLQNEQDLINIMGSMYLFMMVMGQSNHASIVPIIITQRTIVYQERFVGMYSSKAYSLAQVQTT
ncbi:hypothetical protein Gorai_022961 [Gossypium raimondii]|uniref:ABC-2 type transporter transmembrane domain-containing protein n=1 Tax=Gossypium raimondii TaxID=29730 RepID=A0A7J8NV31_GOSRA|nr:hypothetical protein [Gossypium raimondii]